MLQVSAAQLETILTSAGVAVMEMPILQEQDGAPLAIPRKLGMTSDRLTTVELLGDPVDLTRVMFAGGMPFDRPAVAARNGMLMALLLTIALPDWPGAGSWLNKKLRELRRTKTASMSFRGRNVQLTFDQLRAIVTLEIEGVRRDTVAAS